MADNVTGSKAKVENTNLKSLMQQARLKPTVIHSIAQIAFPSPLV